MARPTKAGTPRPGAARLLWALACALLAAALPGCAKRPSARPESMPPAVLLPAAQAGITDGRARFREILTAVLAARGGPAQGEAPLWRLAGEGGPTGLPVNLELSRAGLTVVMVPGLMAECVADVAPLFGDALAGLEAQGYRTAAIRTEGRSGCERNAGIIRDALLALPEGTRAILLAHSKGVPDSLTALAAHPELAGRVAALVSVSGAVNGSPLAEVMPDLLVRLAETLPFSGCAPGPPGEALASLRPDVRLAWLARHPLPAGVRFYSLPAFAARENTSAALRPFFDILAATDPLNDGLMACRDAIIPGSTLLGYPDADHLAVAMPFDKSRNPLWRTAFNRNAYPRAALAEAVARFVEEDITRNAP
ncbi:alpha/beta hydrolase [Fundidesulfovibrio soli]|uniref:alpha/beta hydrolase n=1 Tax=Fundidesulfovibrio soli TaxID=2922716 RepID=UPI001FAEFCE6|nr:alpha/beta hydrolase [Fundidesulfovibrio soli]